MSTVKDPIEVRVSRVKSVLVDDSKPRPVFFLGAGASVKSGIPLVRDVVQQIARVGYCHDQGWDLRDPRPQQSDWLQWLRAQSWFDEAAPLEVTYPQLVERVLVPKQVRKDFFQRALRERASPSVGYQHLAELVAKGWVRTVLTANFDDLVYQSCRALPGAALIEAIKSPFEMHLVSSDPAVPQVVHVHGTVEHYTDCNLQDETQTMHPDVKVAINPLLKDHPLVVVGYRGAEPSVMKDLLLDGSSAAGNYPHGIYWCTRRVDDLHPRVVELAARVGTNLMVVPIDGFDEFIGELNEGTTRSARVAPPTQPTTPELRPAAISDDRYDWHFLEANLPAVADALGIAVPSKVDHGWLTEVLVQLNLASELEDGTVRPTRAGELLLSRDDPITVEVNWGPIRRSLVGNICQVLADATDLLTEANAPFRLKGPKSVNVRPYPPLALKELLVNCLAHADHDADAPITVVGAVDTVTFANRGSLMEGVDASGLGRTSNRAYRNPVIANFLYGYGAMDKFGSGLVHVREWAQLDGGDATFVVDDCSFIATLTSRPERPDDGASIATPAEGYEVFYANALPVRFRRGVIDIGATTVTSRAEVFERNAGVQTAPFNPHGGNLLTLSDLEATGNPLSREVRGSVKHVTISDFCEDADDERLLVQLLNESLRRHAKNRGLLVYGREQRLYFAKSASGERRVSYHGRLKDSTRTVVKVRRSRTTNEVTYYEHHAVRWQFRRFGDDWYLLLVPGWIFTRDGEEEVLHPKRVTSLSTRRAARDYNPNVSAHLYFWASVLVGDDARDVLLADGAGEVVLERQPVTAHLAGVPTPAAGEDDDADGADDDLDKLEGELERLAVASDEDDDE
jgi:NAD-dependent SIR2 family protein deacetylase